MDNPTLAGTTAQLINEFKLFAEGESDEQAIQQAQRILEAQIADLQREANLPACKKKGLMFDNIVQNRQLEAKLKDKQTPLEFLYKVFNDESIHIDFRVKAATQALSYVHRKMPAQIEHTGKDGEAIAFETNDARDRLTAVLFNNDIIDAEFIEVAELEDKTDEEG